mmetsp:Transcript_531/g.1943  ORF Transcript_531/g.1943 Transcript_531/m.1943 type:complete len:437 (+) Transcript_531:1467-2777(+)
MLELAKLGPRRAVVRRPLEVLFVEGAAAVEVGELELELDVGFEELVLRRHPDRHPHDFARRVEAQLPNLKLRRHDPHLGKGKLFVRDELQALAVHLARAIHVGRLEFLPQGIIDPEVDVALPVALLLRRWEVCDGALVHVPNFFRVPRVLLEPAVIEPRVVVGRIGADRLLVLEPPLSHNHVLDPLPVAVLLLKRDKGLVELRRLRLGQVIQRVLVNSARALHLLHHLLKLCKRNVQMLHPVLPVQKFHGALVHLAALLHEPLLVLKLGVLDPHRHRGVAQHEPLVNLPCAVRLAVPHLHVDVRRPPLHVGLPLHPALENLPRTRNVPEHLLHVDVLVPELVDSREDCHRPIPNVPRMVDEAVTHLHLSVLNPYRLVAPKLVESALPHRTRAVVVALPLLPLCVLQPHGLVPPNAPQRVLKLLALLQAVLRELLRV